MKNKLSYPVILTPDLENSGFVVTFPDLPEAITQGDTLEQAQQEATGSSPSPAGRGSG